MSGYLYLDDLLFMFGLELTDIMCSIRAILIFIRSFLLILPFISPFASILLVMQSTQSTHYPEFVIPALPLPNILFFVPLLNFGVSKTIAELRQLY